MLYEWFRENLRGSKKKPQFFFTLNSKYRDNEEIVLAAFDQEKKSILSAVSQRILHSKEIMLLLHRVHDGVLNYVAEELLNDPKFILECIKQRNETKIDLTPSLLNNTLFLKELKRVCPDRIPQVDYPGEDTSLNPNTPQENPYLNT